MSLAPQQPMEQDSFGLKWCGKQSSFFPPLKKISQSFPITGLEKKIDLLKFMKNQQVRYQCLWFGTWIWSLQRRSKALTTCDSAMIRITISSYTPTCKCLLMIAIKSIAEEQTSHWTDLDFLSYDFQQSWNFLILSASQWELFPFRFSVNNKKSEAAESEELVGPGEKY